MGGHGVETDHRQQELFLMVDAAVDGDESREYSFRGNGDFARRVEFQARRWRGIWYRQGAGANRRRCERVGIAGDPGIPGREISRRSFVAG